MLKRKAYQKFAEWKNTKTKQGLLVAGARQVGKTYLIREFAKENYANFAEINLLGNELAINAFKEATNASELMARISILSNVELVPGETLVFLDEVQEYKEIVTAIKFLVEQNDYDFVLSGSLLGVELKNIRSVPVGYLDTVILYPLDFEEYCQAKNLPAFALEAARAAFDACTPVPDYIHDRLLSLFYEYLIVGGMPAAVSAFLETNNLLTVRRIQANLILQNKQDISKYNEADALIIKEIYDLIPSELNNQNKRFILKDMKTNARYGRYEECFIWLADAGVALPVFNADAPMYPLLLSKASNLFKLFMADVGLLTSTFIKDTSIEILNKNPNVNYGSIFENAVAQELKSQKFELYYYRSKKFGELDFVVETPGGTVIPIEVKSGKNYKRHNALRNVLARGDYSISKGYVLSEANVEADGDVTYLPIYMTMYLSLL
ncbi:ATPase AAA [Clostridia bacterium]|nr:ATPase AAA [Clostridia bacterium]